MKWQAQHTKDQGDGATMKIARRVAEARNCLQVENRPGAIRIVGKDLGLDEFQCWCDGAVMKLGNPSISPLDRVVVDERCLHYIPAVSHLSETHSLYRKRSSTSLSCGSGQSLRPSTCPPSPSLLGLRSTGKHERLHVRKVSRTQTRVSTKSV